MQSRSTAKSRKRYDGKAGRQCGVRSIPFTVLNDFLTMSVKDIKRSLRKALLEDGPMEQELYEYDLEETLDFMRGSMAEDDDDFIFSITEANGDVAMVLIERNGDLHINEKARERLKALWPVAYQSNIEMFIPSFADQLEEGEMPLNGVKVVGRDTL